MATVRITPELADIVRQTCAACSLRISEVCLRVCRSLDLRPMSHDASHPDCVTSAGDVRLRWRGDLPDGATAQDFRERLYDKCQDALARHQERTPFSTPLREGVDYIVREVE